MVVPRPRPPQSSMKREPGLGLGSASIWAPAITISSSSTGCPERRALGAGHVIADVDPWPGGYRAAMAVTQDVEHDFENSRLLARRFADLEAPVTFFVVSKLVRGHTELAETLLAGGGRLAQCGSPSSRGPLVGEPACGLRQARNDVRGWTGERR